MKKVITYGTFDMLHYGHRNLLERAKAMGDYLVVGVTSDDFDRRRGKINTHQSLMERMAGVRALEIADEIIVEEYVGQKIDDIKRYEIDIFTVGSDWEGEFDYLKDYCEVVYLPRTEGVSSTDIRTHNGALALKIIGNHSVAVKFAKECSYVNGVAVTNDNPDAVYIDSHPRRHYKDIKKALNEGKHVIAESPIATSGAECEELFALAKANDLVLMDGIKSAYSTAYARLLLLVKSGAIGSVVSVDATCTSLEDIIRGPEDIKEKWNSICAWGPTALLPVFQILGTDYKSKNVTSFHVDEEKTFDGFTKIDFVYDRAVASIKVAKTAKSEGNLVITGTRGYIYVPAPWWKMDYFEVRYENAENNKRHFYQLDGEGIRYEIVAFAKTIETGRNYSYISEEESVAIASVIEDCMNIWKADVR